MAKTKETVKAAAAERLKQLTSTTPTEPPKTRVRQKASSSKRVKVSETTPPPAEPDFDITWGNFSKIKATHGLTDKETQDVLLKVVGPDPTGTTFWADYQRRVKQEIALETKAKSSAAPPVEPPVEPPAEPVEPKRRRLKYLYFTAGPPNPASVVPTEVPHDAPMDDDDDGDDFCECEEEEMIDDDEEVPVECGSRGDDDQDSPSGAAATKVEKPEVVVQRPEPAEPVRVPVLPKDDDPAACARAELEKKLATRPTAVRSGRSVQHNVKRAYDPIEHDDDGEKNEDTALHSMLFLAFILP